MSDFAAEMALPLYFPFDGTCVCSYLADLKLTFDDAAAAPLYTHSNLILAASSVLRSVLEECPLEDGVLHVGKDDRNTWMLLLNMAHPLSSGEYNLNIALKSLKTRERVGALAKKYDFQSVLNKLEEALSRQMCIDAGAWMVRGHPASPPQPIPSSSRVSSMNTVYPKYPTMYGEGDRQMAQSPFPPHTPMDPLCPGPLSFMPDLYHTHNSPTGSMLPYGVPPPLPLPSLGSPSTNANGYRYFPYVPPPPAPSVPFTGPYYYNRFTSYPSFPSSPTDVLPKPFTLPLACSRTTKLDICAKLLPLMEHAAHLHMTNAWTLGMEILLPRLKAECQTHKIRPSDMTTTKRLGTSGMQIKQMLERLRDDGYDKEALDFALDFFEHF